MRERESIRECRHKRCIENGSVNCIRSKRISQKHFRNEFFKRFLDEKKHLWKKISSAMRPDGVSVTVEKCKIIGCNLWRVVSLEWVKIEGRMTVKPTVQYVDIIEHKTNNLMRPDGKEISTGQIQDRNP